MDNCRQDALALLQERYTDAYVDILRRFVAELEELDKETGFYPRLELTESGTPGKWRDRFSRGWNLWEREDDTQDISILQAKCEESQKKVKEYSARIVELQNSLANENRDRRY